MCPTRARRVVIVLAASLVSGCTAGGATAPPSGPSSSTSSSSAPRAATPTARCATPPAAATAAPTDFPHPSLTRHPVTAPPDASDAALAQQGLAAVSAFGGPVATSAFRHFLDGSGSFLALPVDGLVTADPGFVTELDTALVRAAGTAVARAGTVAPCTMVAFSSGWLPHDDVADPDWHYTLGRFWFQVRGTATREATGVRVVYRAAIGDTYDFDPGTAFARFEQLALDGHAADFLDGGLTAARSATVTTAADLASPGFA